MSSKKSSTIRLFPTQTKTSPASTTPQSPLQPVEKFAEEANRVEELINYVEDLSLSVQNNPFLSLMPSTSSIPSSTVPLQTPSSPTQSLPPSDTTRDINQILSSYIQSSSRNSIVIPSGVIASSSSNTSISSSSSGQNLNSSTGGTTSGGTSGGFVSKVKKRTSRLFNDASFNGSTDEIDPSSPSPDSQPISEDVTEEVVDEDNDKERENNRERERDVERDILTRLSVDIVTETQQTLQNLEPIFKEYYYSLLLSLPSSERISLMRNDLENTRQSKKKIEKIEKEIEQQTNKLKQMKELQKKNKTIDLAKIHETETELGSLKKNSLLINQEISQTLRKLDSGARIIITVINLSIMRGIENLFNYSFQKLLTEKKVQFEKITQLQSDWTTTLNKLSSQSVLPLVPNSQQSVISTDERRRSDIEGWIDKRNSKGEWIPRYFVLSIATKKLSYFKSIDSSINNNTRGSVYLSNPSICSFSSVSDREKEREKDPEREKEKEKETEKELIIGKEKENVYVLSVDPNMYSLKKRDRSTEEVEEDENNWYLSFRSPEDEKNWVYAINSSLSLSISDSLSLSSPPGMNTSIISNSTLPNSFSPSSLSIFNSLSVSSLLDEEKTMYTSDEENEISPLPSNDQIPQSIPPPLTSLPPLPIELTNLPPPPLSPSSLPPLLSPSSLPPPPSFSDLPPPTSLPPPLDPTILPPPPTSEEDDGTPQEGFTRNRTMTTTETEEGKRNLIKQTITAEKTYVSQLHAIINVYLAELRKDSKLRSKLSQEQIHEYSLFTNIENIYHLHCEILGDLQQCYDQWPLKAIGATFLRVAPFFSMYKVYITNYTVATTLIERLKKFSKPFLNYLKTCEQKVDFPLDLVALLGTPCQRVPKYWMFIEKLIRGTHVNHSDYLNLMDSAAIMKEISETVMYTYKYTKQLTFLTELQCRLTEIQESIVQPNRTFIREGDLVVRQDGANPETAHFFLFSDMFIMTKKLTGSSLLGFSEKFKFIQKIGLHKADIIDVKDKKDLKNCLDVKTGPSTRMTLVAPNEKEKGIWLTELCKVVANLKTTKNTYGAPLEILMETKREKGRTIPTLIEKACNYIEEHGLDSEGIFRISGEVLETEGFKDTIDQGKEIDFSSATNPHIVASLLKQYLRELPEPIMTWKLYPPFIATVDEYGTNPTEQVKYLHSVVDQLPSHNKYLVQYLTKFLNLVASHSSTNKMTPHNLTILFAPNMLRAKDQSPLAIGNLQKTYDIVETLMENYEQIFSEIEKERIEKQENWVLNQETELRMKKKKVEEISERLKGEGSSVAITSDEQKVQALALGESVKEGWLKKKGGKGHSGWKSWYFVLKYQVLSYYTSPKDSVPKGRIQLTDCTVGSTTRKEFCFAINTTTEGTHFLCAESQTETDEWIKALLECMD